MDVAVFALVVGSFFATKKRKKRTIWEKKYRRLHNHFPLLRVLREDYPDDYRNYLRMNSEQFDCLLAMVYSRIKKKDTVMRKSFTPFERLATTLRFLATGRSYEDLKFSSGMSASALSAIIPETCKAIYEALKKDYMKFPSTTEEWLDVAKGFSERWNFVNCGGALDGKHIRIIEPPNSGASYYNYKNFYSIVLLGLVNANYEFIFVDVGKNGRLSDGGVIEYTTFYRKLLSAQLNMPNRELNKNNLNYVIIGDEGFALNEHLLTPYPQRELDYEKRIFNYRLSRARNVVENAFGIIASRFQILRTPINMKIENTCYVILAICAIHNFLRRKNAAYITSATVDRVDTTSGEVQFGEWRQENVQLVGLDAVPLRNVSMRAKQSRDEYKTYFNSAGSVPWQDNMIRMGRAYL